MGHSLFDRPREAARGQQTAILAYLAAAYWRNPDSEVPGLELVHELGITLETVRAAAAELAHEGLVEWDPLLSNLWLHITEKGLAAAESQATP